MFSQACVKNSVRGGYSPPLARPPPQTHHQTATAVDGTHPTGMHSCNYLIGLLSRFLPKTRWTKHTFQVRIFATMMNNGYPTG